MTLGCYFDNRRIIPLDVKPGVSTPLRFSDPRAEHLATRKSAGLFDFSFMTCISVSGYQSLDLLERIQVRNVRQLLPGRIAYTMLCRQDGTVMDDATIWCRAVNDYWLFVGLGSDLFHIESMAVGLDVAVSDRSKRQSVLSLQGPKSFQILQGIFPEYEIGTLPYYRFREYAFGEATLWLARIGDSGELGYEMVIDVEAGAALWQRLAAAGAPLGLLECGFSSADSLRIEAGHILFSKDLAVTPYELGFGRLVRQNGVAFLGCEALSKLRFAPPRYRLAGLMLTDSGISALELARRADVADSFSLIRPGISRPHSVCISPIFERVIALGFVADGDHYPGTGVQLPNYGTARVARLPFYDPTKRLPRTPIV